LIAAAAVDPQERSAQSFAFLADRSVNGCLFRRRQPVEDAETPPTSG
jgi:hypothetical protein